MDRVENDLVPPSHLPNWTSCQSYFLAVILSRHVLKNTTVKWLKKKIVCSAKIWKPPRQHFGFFEDWRNFGNPEKFGKFLKLGVALILRYLLTDLLLIQTKLAPVTPGPSVSENDTGLAKVDLSHKDLGFIDRNKALRCGTKSRGLPGGVACSLDPLKISLFLPCSLRGSWSY